MPRLFHLSRATLHADRMHELLERHDGRKTLRARNYELPVNNTNPPCTLNNINWLRSLFPFDRYSGGRFQRNVGDDNNAPTDRSVNGAEEKREERGRDPRWIVQAARRTPPPTNSRAERRIGTNEFIIKPCKTI